MAAKFQGVDFYDVDGLLSEEERAVRDTVRSWVDERLMPIIGEHYVEGRFPKQLIPQMAERRLRPLRSHIARRGPGRCSGHCARAGPALR